MSYERGLQRVGDATHAYLQPDGGWGWSNAGVIEGPDGPILVDTFFDLAHTRQLLDAVADIDDRPVTAVVNTHHNGDHTWGNQLVDGATIVGHRHCRSELLASAPPDLLATIARSPDEDGAVGYLKRAFAAFDFSGIELRPPTVTFDEELTLHAGDREVQLLHLGPGHTLGDIVVWVPDDRTLFAGDLCFLGSTPLVWEGSLSNWTSAIDRMLALDPRVVVPGHGPVTDADGLREVRGYLERVISAGKRLKTEGLDPGEAAKRLDLGPYADWLDSERLVLNLMRLWRELDGEPPESRMDPFEVFAAMDTLARAWGR